MPVCLRVKFRFVRKVLLLAFLCGFASASQVSAAAATRQRILSYFGGWYSYLPGSRVSATETREVILTGLETYRIERHSESRAHQEANVAFFDPARDEVFVGDVFHDPNRAAARRPFDSAKDLGNVEASLREAFGLPVGVTTDEPRRGTLIPLTVSIDQQKNAFATRTGFVSTDGATLLLGEFHPLGESAGAFRRRLLSQSPSPSKARGGAFAVVEFVDFECERCRKRWPEVQLAASLRGGTVEARFLPLVKTHDWAFAAAEQGAALAATGAAAFARYEEAVFARQEKMTAAAARELAADIAEADGLTQAYELELTSGRARQRVLSDITLAIRLGIGGTPSFVENGVFVSGEHDLLETFLAERYPLAPTEDRARKNP